MDEADSSCRFYHHQTVPMLPPFKFFIRVKSHNLSPYFSTIPIMQKTRLSEAVKALTSSAHQALEKRLVIIIRQIGSVEDYRRLLLLFYGYYKPVERLIETHLNTSSPIPHQTRKSDTLLSDIN